MPAPIVKNSGIILNLPAFPDMFIMKRKPYALYKNRYSWFSRKNLFANLI